MQTQNVFWKLFSNQWLETGSRTGIFKAQDIVAQVRAASGGHDANVVEMLREVLCDGGRLQRELTSGNEHQSL